MKGHVEQRGAASWRIQAYVGVDPATGKRKYVRRTVRGSRRDAELALARLLVEIGDGAVEDGPDCTVTQLVNRWLSHVEADLSPATLDDYRRVARIHIEPRIGSMQISRVRPSDLDKLYRERLGSVSAARVRRIHQVLAGAFQQAVRWRWIATNPARDATKPRVIEREIRPPTPSTLQAILAAAGEIHPDLPTFLALAATTGARRGELVAARWDRINLDDATWLVDRSLLLSSQGLAEKPTKTHQARRISLAPPMVTSLRRHRSRQAERMLAVGLTVPDDGWVFSSVEGRPWRPDEATRRFFSACKLAGVGGVRLHDLRHLMATELLSAGIDVRTVAGRGGWRQAATLLGRYAHFMPQADRAAAETMGRLLGG